MSETNETGAAEAQPFGDLGGARANAPMKTPMFQASHADRYQRQSLIKKIENETKRRLICFVCGEDALIKRDDTLGFVDLLTNVQQGEDLSLLLHTPGGDPDAAEKLITLVHKKVDGATLHVIVPDYAKSAGTLMALGANKIIMSDSSELGPIDPQIILEDGRGNRINHSVLCFLDAYETHEAALRANPDDPVALMMLAKLDPATVKMFEAVRARARTFAETQLRQWMFRGGSGNVTKIANDLMDTKRFPSHGQMVGYEDAVDMGLVADYLAPTDPVWMDYWQLYCLQRLAVKDAERLFESNYVSLVF